MPEQEGQEETNGDDRRAALWQRQAEASRVPTDGIFPRAAPLLLEGAVAEKFLGPRHVRLPRLQEVVRVEIEGQGRQQPDEH